MRKPYQPDYKPSPLSEDERGARELGFAAANMEVTRVAHNIMVALENPQTPAVVKAYISAYLSRLFTWNMTTDPASAGVLYPIACRKISQVPFVPGRAHIEALTGNDRAAAIKAARAANVDESDKPFESVTHEHMERLVEAVFKWDDYEREKGDDGALALVALMHSLAYERSFHHRWTIADTAMKRVFAFSSSSYEPRERFIEKAIKLYGGGKR